MLTNKTCSICFEDKPLPAFSYVKIYYTRKKDNITSVYTYIPKSCSKCRNSHKRARVNRRKETLIAY